MKIIWRDDVRLERFTGEDGMNYAIPLENLPDELEVYRKAEMLTRGLVVEPRKIRGQKPKPLLQNKDNEPLRNEDLERLRLRALADYRKKLEALRLVEETIHSMEAPCI